MPDRPPKRLPVLDEAALLMPGLVHEMRQPVMGMKAGLQLLARELGERLTGLDDWHLVVSQLARLEEIFDACQLFTQEVPTEARPFEVAPVVLRAVDLLRFRTKKLGRRFAVIAPGDLPAALGAPSALLHAVTNLVVNALDAVEGAADGARVEVRLLPPGGAQERVQVRVSDNGCGVPGALRERLFEPLFTTKPPGAGTGLGLHTARRLLSAVGARVELLADDAPLRQRWAVTEFCIELPVVPEVAW
jgi:two-component system nitrogen regulation sensor histidine kinase GlnL